jgi:hypothetical protein
MMLDELLFGGIAVLSLVALFHTRSYMQRLAQVHKGNKKLIREMREFRQWYEDTFEPVVDEPEKTKRDNNLD